VQSSLRIDSACLAVQRVVPSKFSLFPTSLNVIDSFLENLDLSLSEGKRGEKIEEIGRTRAVEPVDKDEPRPDCFLDSFPLLDLQPSKYISREERSPIPGKVVESINRIFHGRLGLLSVLPRLYEIWSCQSSSISSPQVDYQAHRFTL